MTSQKYTSEQQYGEKMVVQKQHKHGNVSSGRTYPVLNRSGGEKNLQLTSPDPICAPSVWLVFSLACNWTESHSVPQHHILMPASNTWKPDNSVGPGSAVSSACQNQRTSKKFAWPRNLATAYSQHLFAILDQVNGESRQLAHLNPPTLRKKKKKFCYLFRLLL